MLKGKSPCMVPNSSSLTFEAVFTEQSPPTPAGFLSTALSTLDAVGVKCSALRARTDGPPVARSEFLAGLSRSQTHLHVYSEEMVLRYTPVEMHEALHGTIENVSPNVLDPFADLIVES